MLVLLEVPLVAFAVAPDWTPGMVERFKSWMNRNGARALSTALAVLGAALIVRAALEIYF
jgi:hypothetical protein